MKTWCRLVLVGAFTLQGPAAFAQAPALEALRGGVPTGEVSPEVLALTLDDAIARGLHHNLALILGQEQVRYAQGEQGEAKSDLLPHLRAGASAVREKVSLAAFGFSGFGDFPELIGPFNVVDARGYLSQTVFDLHALRHSQAQGRDAEAAALRQRSTRDTVVLGCAGLYLRAVAAESRIGAVEAQLATAQALFDLAQDQKASGLVAGVDVLRAQVELAAQRQRSIVARADAAKFKLALARAIGLPLGQAFALADEMPLNPLPPIPEDEALRRAYDTRADLKAAAAHVEAMEQERRAAQGDGLPSLAVSGDYGAIGNTVGGARPTFTALASLRVPIFEGGKVKAKVQQADARLVAARATLEDTRARVYYDIKTTLLDLRSTEERVQVATSAFDLAGKQLEQAKDRFKAGVAGNIDVALAQEALARATEDRIQSLLENNVGKAELARALGVAETPYREFLGGRP
jgi:outer membrane protein TolC